MDSNKTFDRSSDQASFKPPFLTTERPIVNRHHFLSASLAFVFASFLTGCPIYTGDGGTTGPVCNGPLDCASGYACISGTCQMRVSCSFDSQCGNGYRCNAGTCIPRSDSGIVDAGTDGRIDGGNPTQCRADGDCLSGTRCASNICIPSTSCAGDSECSSAEWCDFRGTCVPRPVGSCRRTSDCGAQQVCNENVCINVPDTCQLNRDCGNGRLCLNNQCTSACSLDSQCSNGQTCQGNYCREAPQECTSSSMCSSGEVCTNGRCLADCRTTNQCSNALVCQSDKFCHPPVAPRPFCQNDNECATGRVCRAGVCRTPCPLMTNAQCSSIDQSLPNCLQDAQSQEYLCFANSETTAPECHVPTACGDARDCIDGQCRNRN